MQHERSIFLDVIEQSDESAQQAVLETACGNDAALRKKVQALLDAHRCPSNVLDQPVSHLSDSAIQALQRCDDTASSSNGVSSFSNSFSGEGMVGQVIGDYRLMEQIGEGGFGLVFVAQQQHPIRRKVALKIVKPGTGSQEVIARFNAERQAIGMMDHPNIASVFDAGMSENGHPYFVMELVRGITITDFSVSNELTIRDRLELFKTVCSAVHHAHQKAVIHRDLKPSNVLVTLHDHQPVAKVIDFGVAKAIDHKLTDKTIYTRFFSMIGTPLYMSPEQAEMSGLDVDTRSDIYSLGVLLYELLTGVTPFDRARIDSAGLDELRRIIREEEPPRPSQRATTVDSIERTQTIPRGQRRYGNALRIQGDLDWIVMKAIEKDRTRRYDSAMAMSDDITRFLLGQPIEARPPSILYLLTRFSNRHRAAIMTAFLVLASLCVGTAASVWQMRVAINERDQKVEALHEANQAKQKIEAFASQLTRANELVTSGQAYADLGQWPEAILKYDAAVEQQPGYFLSWERRAQLYLRMQLWDEAAADFAKALELGATPDGTQWKGVPILFVLTHRTEDYKTICQKRIERCSADNRPSLELIHELTVSRDSDSLLLDVPWTRSNLASLAEEWLIETEFLPPPRNRQFRDDFGNGDSVLPKPVRHYIAGMSCLRAADWQNALKDLEDEWVAGRWPGAPMRFAPQAIAYHHLGNLEEAKSRLELSNTALTNTTDNLDLQRNGEPAHEMPWFELVEAFVINREANLLITGSSDIAERRIELFRTRALQISRQ